MFNNKNNFDDYDYEMEEIENNFGSDFSQITEKFVSSKPKKNHKDLKFHKDGFYDKNKK